MSARGNGLRANAYAVLMEVDEITGARMLDALAERRIAAYVVPAAGPDAAPLSGHQGRFILHVDAAQRVPARIVLAGLTPALAAEAGADAGEPAGDPAGAAPAQHASIDAMFAQLVAGFHEAPASRTWPDAEDLPADDVPAEGQTGAADPSPPATPDRPSPTALTKPVSPSADPALPPRSWDPSADPDRRRHPDDRPGAASRSVLPASFSKTPTPETPTPKAPTPQDGTSRRRVVADRMSPPPAGPPGADDIDDFDGVDDYDESHYVPPHLPKLKPAAAATRWAFAAMALGLALLLVPTLLTLDHTTSTDILGVACVLGATACLLTRLRPDSTNAPDDPDDGAVV